MSHFVWHNKVSHMMRCCFRQPHMRLVKSVMGRDTVVAESGWSKHRQLIWLDRYLKYNVEMIGYRVKQ